jgi:hypothetical protein
MTEKKYFTKKEVKTYGDLFKEECTPGIDHVNDTVKFNFISKLIKGADIPDNYTNQILAKVGAKKDEFTEI